MVRWMFAVLALAAACSNSAPQASDPPVATDKAAAIPTVTVDELDQLIAAGGCQPVDANGEGTRKRFGVIPGALLLSDSELFKVSELPANKRTALVFYCANEHCDASHEAASRARLAGYSDVRVLPAGIAGWANAGKHTRRL